MLQTLRSVCALMALLCWASTGLIGQELRVSARCDNCELSSLLHSWAESHNLLFAYESSLLADKRLTVNFEQKTISAALTEVLSPFSMVAQQAAPGQWIILPSAQAAVSRIGERSTVRGRVIQAETGEPLAFASVQWGKQGIFTNDEGRFSVIFQGYLPDSLEVSYLGFQPIKVACRVDQSLMIELHPQDFTIRDVFITDGIQPTLEVGDGGREIQMDPARLHLLSGLGESDLLRSIQLLPGLSAANERATGLYVRGGTPSENLILYDGITVYQPGHFFGLLSAFNPEAVKDIRLYRSGVGARYGGRTAAVIDITGKPGRLYKPRAAVSMNLMNLQAYAEVPWENDRGGLLIAARRSYTDVAPSAFFRRLFDSRFQEGVIFFYGQKDGSEGVTVDPRLHYYDVNLKWLYRPNDRELISITAIKSGDELTYHLEEKPLTGPSLMSEDQLRMINDGAALTWTRQWNSDHYTRFNSSYSGYRNRYQYSYQTSSQVFEYRSDLRRAQLLRDVSLRLEHVWTPGEQTRFSAGWHQSEIWLEGVQSLDDSQSDPLREVSSGDQSLGALFLEGAGENDVAGYEIGLRGNTLLKGQGAIYVEPRLMGFLNLAKGWRLQANAGRYHQFLNYVSVYNGLEAGEDYWALADADSIPTLRADMFSLSLSKAWDGYLLQVEGYTKQMEGLVAYELSYNPNLNETDLGRRLVDGIGRVSGLEVLAQKKTGIYTGWIAYTYSRVLQQFPSSEGESFVPADFDRPHQLSVVNQIKTSRWELAATWIAASGTPYTPAVGVLSEELPNGEFLYFLEFGERNSERLPLYHRLDLTATYTLGTKSGEGRIGVSVFNAYGQRNLGNRIFAIQPPGTPGEAASLVVLDKPLLGFTPNVFMLFRW